MGATSEPIFFPSYSHNIRLQCCQGDLADRFLVSIIGFSRNHVLYDWQPQSGLTIAIISWYVWNHLFFSLYTKSPDHILALWGLLIQIARHSHVWNACYSCWENNTPFGLDLIKYTLGIWFKLNTVCIFYIFALNV